MILLRNAFKIIADLVLILHPSKLLAQFLCLIFKVIGILLELKHPNLQVSFSLLLLKIMFEITISLQIFINNNAFLSSFE
jgi:hypothetical protein